MIIMKKIAGLLFVFCLMSSFAKSQTAEVTIQLNEQFFDVLLDALFQNGGSPEFPISRNSEEKNKNGKQEKTLFAKTSFGNENKKSENEKPDLNNENANPPCNDSIRLLRETSGVRTSVNLRDGRVFAPIAFVGSYNPPLIGCVEFSGVADTNIVLEFDEQRQALIGRAQVTNVNLNGTGGIGGGFLARLVQSAIDRKINPIEIIKLDKVSFTIPIQNAGNLKMKAVGVRYEIGNGFINVRIAYQFVKI